MVPPAGTVQNSPDFRSCLCPPMMVTSSPPVSWTMRGPSSGNRAIVCRLSMIQLRMTTWTTREDPSLARTVTGPLKRSTGLRSRAPSPPGTGAICATDDPEKMTPIRTIPLMRPRQRGDMAAPLPLMAPAFRGARARGHIDAAPYQHGLGEDLAAQRNLDQHGGLGDEAQHRPWHKRADDC